LLDLESCWRCRYDVLVGGLRLRQASGQLTPMELATVSRMTARPQ